MNYFERETKTQFPLILTLPLFFAVLAACSHPLPCVELETDLGNIVLEIDTVNAPETAANFLRRVKEGTYNDAFFYRVVRKNNQPDNSIKIEVIQGGLFNEATIANYPVIAHETTVKTGLKHLNGTLSMARAEPGTASTEFFICIGSQPELDFNGRRNPDGQGFAAFGRVIKGLDVVRKVQNLPDKNQYLLKPVKIIQASIKTRR